MLNHAANGVVYKRAAGRYLEAAVDRIRDIETASSVRVAPVDFRLIGIPLLPPKLSESCSWEEGHKSYKVANVHDDIFVIVVVSLVGGIVSDDKRCTKTMRVLSEKVPHVRKEPKEQEATGLAGATCPILWLWTQKVPATTACQVYV